MFPLRICGNHTQIELSSQPNSSGRQLRTVLIFTEFLLVNLRFDFLSAPDSTLANPWAEAGDFLAPRSCVHRFRPEGPGTTLRRPSFINSASFIFKKHTLVPLGELQFPYSIFLIAVTLRKSARGNSKLFSHRLPIGLGHVHVTISPARDAAVAGALTLKLNSIGPELLLHTQEFCQY